MYRILRRTIKKNKKRKLNEIVKIEKVEAVTDPTFFS